MIREKLSENAALVEQALQAALAENDVDFAEELEAERYSLLAKAKRIRPTLVLEFCRMFGGSDAAALPFAMAVEMVHTYSLIHDDLPCMDDDTYRRGRLTCHKKFDEATAVLAGDALLTDAFGIAAGNAHVSPEAAREAVLLLSEAAGSRGMVGGQILDMSAEQNNVSGIGDILRLQSLKTGALIRAAAKLGCIAAGKGSGTKEYQAADRFAAEIGLAFQIVDDVLDVEGNAEQLGKETGSDAKMNKVTFLHFYSVKEARAYAAKLTAEAKNAIAFLPESETLCALADYLLDRKY